jgi:hypothetical protein
LSCLFDFFSASYRRRCAATFSKSTVFGHSEARSFQECLSWRRSRLSFPLYRPIHKFHPLFLVPPFSLYRPLSLTVSCPPTPKTTVFQLSEGLILLNKVISSIYRAARSFFICRITNFLHFFDSAIYTLSTPVTVNLVVLHFRPQRCISYLIYHDASFLPYSSANLISQLVTSTNLFLSPFF